MQRTGLHAIVLTAVLLAAGAASAAAQTGQAAGQTAAARGQGLLDSPVPFYHDYNLSVLFPVSRGITAAAVAQSAGDEGPNLSLKDCIERALADSPNHRKTRENLRAAAGELLNAWGNYLPTLSSGFGMGQTNRNSSYVDQSGNVRTSGGISKSSYGQLNFNLTLFNRADHYFEMRNARFFKDERISRIYSSELGLVNQVRQGYFNVLRNKKLLLAAQRQTDQRREQLRLAEARFSVGSVTRLDVLQAQIEVRNAELQIVQYENALATSRMDLNRTMGGKLEAKYSLVDDFEVKHIELKADDLCAEAVKNHPDVKTLELQIRQQQNNLLMGRLAYLPTLSTGASFSRSKDGLDFLPNQVQSRGLSISLGWNILDSFARFRSNRNTEISLNNLNLDLAQKRLDIEREVRAGLLELDRLYQRHVTLGESESLASQSLELQQERYRLGASSLLELRQAQVDYSQAEVNYINSIYDYHIELSRLSLNVGRDLSGQFGN